MWRRRHAAKFRWVKSGGKRRKEGREGDSETDCCGCGLCNSFHDVRLREGGRRAINGGKEEKENTFYFLRGRAFPLRGGAKRQKKYC